MLSCSRKHSEKNRSCSNNKEDTSDNKKLIKDSCLLCGIIIIIFSCIFVFTIMDGEEWTENNYMRQRILLIAVILFMSSTALCLYVWKSVRKEGTEHLELLLIDKPPSYDSVVFQEPPPAYITAVVQSIHIIQQETTG